MEKERLYYIDWLRVLVVLSLIVYHSALTYTGLGDIYIRRPLHDVRGLPFLIITVPLRSYFMTLLFFVSGIASYYSFRYRGRRKFISERVKKVLLPFVLGTLFLCPIQAYFMARSNGFAGNLLDFTPEFFSPKIAAYLGYAHLWFLLYLFVFSFVCVPFFTKWSGNDARSNRIAQDLSKGNAIYIPILLIVIAEMILRPFFPGPQTLMGDWANDIVYLSIFLYGFVYASDKGIQQRVSRLAKPSKTIFFVLAAAYVLIEYLIMLNEARFEWLKIVLDVSKGLYECAAIIYLLWLGNRYMNKKSAVLSFLNKASFPIYLIHFVPVSMFTYLFIEKQINVYIKYLLVVILSYFFVFAVYTVLIRPAQTFLQECLGRK